MAHALDTRANGQSSFVSLRQSAWHQLGTVVGDELSYEEALNLGGLDYPLHLRPLTTTSPIFTNDGVESDSVELSAPGFAVVRSDRHQVLGTVGASYTIVGNRESTAVVEELVDKGLARIETAGVLREGRDAWMALRFIGSQLDDAGDNGGDTIQFYGLVRMNHDGSCSVQVATTPIRVVCANTLAMCLSDGRTALRRIRHTRSAGVKVIEEAQNLWGGVVSDAQAMAEGFAQLRQRTISPAQFERTVLNVVAPMPATPEPGATPRSHSLYQSALTRAEVQRAELVTLWERGTGQRGALTAWDAFNAVTEGMDHAGVAAATRGDAKANPLVAQLPGGALATAKSAVWNTLLALTA